MKVHEVDVHPALPERIAWLDEIARNVWSAWSPEAGDLFAFEVDVAGLPVTEVGTLGS